MLRSAAFPGLFDDENPVKFTSAVGNNVSPPSLNQVNSVLLMDMLHGHVTDNAVLKTAEKYLMDLALVQLDGPHWTGVARNFSSPNTSKKRWSAILTNDKSCKVALGGGLVYIERGFYTIAIQQFSVGGAWR